MKKDTGFFNEQDDMNPYPKKHNSNLGDSVDDQDPMNFHINDSEDPDMTPLMAAGLVVGSDRDVKDKKDKKGKKGKKKKKKKDKKGKKKPDPKEQSRFASVFDSKPKQTPKKKEKNIFENEYLEDEIDIFGSITMLSKVKPKKRRR